MNLQETIKKLITEETQGIDTFMDEIKSKHKMSDELSNTVKDFIVKSDCNKIAFSNFRIAAMGVALHDFVLINKMVLSQKLELLLFVVFHEIAHQYQFKKYGEDVMYDCYLGEISDEEAAEFMRKTELVADEFATRKIRELQNKGLIEKGFIPPSVYKNMPINQIMVMIKQFRSQIKQQKITTPEKISEFFYNMVKAKEGILGFFGL